MTRLFLGFAGEVKAGKADCYFLNFLVHMGNDAIIGAARSVLVVRA